MTDIYVGASKERLVSELRAAVENISSQSNGNVSFTIYGKANSLDSDVNITFSDEDTDRPEVADLLLIEIEEA